VLAQNFWHKRVAVVVKENVTQKYVSKKAFTISAAEAADKIASNHTHWLS